MSALVFFLIGPFGGLGAWCRWWLDQRIQALTPQLQALGIATVNVVACFLAGLVVQQLLGANEAPSSLLLGMSAHQAWQVSSAGFLGGLSTFSTAIVDVVKLFNARRWWAGLGILLGTWLVSALGFGIGFWI